MIYSIFLQLINLETPLKFLTIVNTLTMKTLQEIIIGGTSTTAGTVGTTITTGTMDITDGTNLIVIGTIAVLFIIAHLLDRWLNRKQNLDQELTSLDQETQD